MEHLRKFRGVRPRERTAVTDVVTQVGDRCCADSTVLSRPVTLEGDGT